MSELGREADVEARPVGREEGRDGEQRSRKRKLLVYNAFSYQCMRP